MNREACKHKLQRRENKGLDEETRGKETPKGKEIR